MANVAVDAKHTRPKVVDPTLEIDGMKAVEDALAAVEFAKKALSGVPGRKAYGDPNTERKKIVGKMQPAGSKDGDDVTVYADEVTVFADDDDDDDECLPYGGATSFAELTQFWTAQRTEWAIENLTSSYTTLVQNIFAQDADDMTIAQKAEAVRSVSDELATLLGQPLAKLQAAGLAEAGKKTGVLESIGSFVKKLTGSAPTPEENAGRSSFFSFVDQKGDWRWLATSTNKFRDRDKELFPQAAHKEYVDMADKLAAVGFKKAYPELWLWHTPGSRIGFADFVDYSDGFVVSSGRYDPGNEAIAAKLAEMQPELGVSHGYQYDVDAKEADGTINRYYDFEVTVLPRERASNMWMPLKEIALKEAHMFRPEKKTFLVSLLGQKKADALEAGLAEFNARLEAEGIDWKEVNAAMAEPPVVTTGTPASGTGGAGTAVLEKPAAKVEPEPKPDEGGGDGEGDEAGLAPRVAALETGVNALLEATKEMATMVKEMKQTDDERIAGLNAPRRPAPNGGGRATESESNVIDLEKMTGLKEQLEEESDGPTEPASRKYVKQLFGQTG